MNADFPVLLSASELPQFCPVSGPSVTGRENGAASRAVFAPAVAAQGRPAEWRSVRPSRGLSERLSWGALAGTLLVAGYLAAAYGVVYEWLPGRLSADLYLYLAQPLIWGGLALLAYGLWRRLPDRPDFKRGLLGLAMLAAVFQLAFLVSAGVLYGFGYSPYAGQALNMAKNALYVITLLAGLEMSRAYLVHVWSRVSTVVAFSVVALLYAAVEIGPAQFDLSGGRERSFETVGSSFLPTASESVMATFLASIGGPLPAFGYRGVLAAFEWFSPILPSLDWPVIAFLGAFTPLLAMLVVRDIHFSPAEETSEESTQRGMGVSPVLLLAGMAVVGLIWLNAGMFGVRPALVSGLSMKPAFEAGDVVFTKEVEPEDLDVGDIVRFDSGGIPIIHRIIDIPEHIEGPYFQAEDEVIELPEGGSGPVFITQGDSNSVADAPIVAQQIEGEVVFTVPKVGWLPIGIKRALERLR